MVQLQSMATHDPQTPAKRLWQILQAVYYLLYKGISKQWLSLELHLLAKRGRLAAKSLKRLTNHQPSARSNVRQYMSSVLSCRSMDPTTAVYVPREVEFSCSNTPDYKPSRLFRKSHKRALAPPLLESSHRVDDVMRIFEILDKGDVLQDEGDVESVVASPSPWISWKTPVGTRQLRVTDSPFLDEDHHDHGRKDAAGAVDMKAEEFIARFREQLRSQQHAFL